MSYAYFSQEELMKRLQELRTAYDDLGDTVEVNMRRGSTWDDMTARELVRNVAVEAERIRNDQTDYMLTPPCSALEIDLTDALNAYDETVAILEGVTR